MSRLRRHTVARMERSGIRGVIKIIVYRRGAEYAEGFYCFVVGATLVANITSDRGEFAVKTAPTGRRPG